MTSYVSQAHLHQCIIYHIMRQTLSELICQILDVSPEFLSYLIDFNRLFTCLVDFLLSLELFTLVISPIIMVGCGL